MRTSTGETDVDRALEVLGEYCWRHAHNIFSSRRTLVEAGAPYLGRAETRSPKLCFSQVASMVGPNHDAV